MRVPLVTPNARSGRQQAREGSTSLKRCPAAAAPLSASWCRPPMRYPGRAVCRHRQAGTAGWEQACCQVRSRLSLSCDARRARRAAFSCHGRSEQTGGARVTSVLKSTARCGPSSEAGATCKVPCRPPRSRGRSHHARRHRWSASPPTRERGAGGACGHAAPSKASRPSMHATPGSGAACWWATGAPGRSAAWPKCQGTSAARRPRAHRTAARGQGRAAQCATRRPCGCAPGAAAPRAWSGPRPGPPP